MAAETATCAGDEGDFSRQIEEVHGMGEGGCGSRMTFMYFEPSLALSC
jgi:hypothetical protein